MNFQVRDGKFDLVVAASPRIDIWPSAGVRALSSICAEMGLSVGLLGGDSLQVRGLIPLPATGGIVLAEDVQNRIHRIEARAVVRLNADVSLPNPFPGWRSQGLIPLSTALRLRRESLVSWAPTTVVLGSGNKALRFASSLLESGVSEVFCVESDPEWEAKRFAGWEVEKRRFEILGGRLIEAEPVQLTPKAPLIWELRLRDAHGIRVLEVARVVSAGPFKDLPSVREYPPGSFLFELDQTASLTRAEDVEGWVMEEERGRYLAGKIARALVSDLGDKREQLDRIYRRARGRLKRYYRHRERPFTPTYQGKWITASDARRMRTYRALPQALQLQKPVASVECFEDIPCNVCESVCPENAIEIGRVPRDKDFLLDESKCTACGICLVGCPSSAIVMVHEKAEHSLSPLTLAWRGNLLWKLGEFAVLTNRRGESLGSARVSALSAVEAGVQLVTLDCPTHLLWEARGLKRPRVGSAEDHAYLEAVRQSSQAAQKVEVTLNGEKRLVRDGTTLAVALFEIGQSRPEDVLYCPDGSCGLCHVQVDGVKKLACQTKVHRGMAVKLNESSDRMPADRGPGDASLCPCLGITAARVREKVEQGNLRSPEAVLSTIHLGEGRCHGMFCLGAFKRLLLEQNLDVGQWVDWRFPWSEWTLHQN